MAVHSELYDRSLWKKMLEFNFDADVTEFFDAKHAITVILAHSTICIIFMKYINYNNFC